MTTNYLKGSRRFNLAIVLLPGVVSTIIGHWCDKWLIAAAIGAAILAVLTQFQRSHIVRAIRRQGDSNLAGVYDEQLSFHVFTVFFIALSLLMFGLAGWPKSDSSIKYVASMFMIFTFPCFAALFGVAWAWQAGYVRCYLDQKAAGQRISRFSGRVLFLVPKPPGIN